MSTRANYGKMRFCEMSFMENGDFIDFFPYPLGRPGGGIIKKREIFRRARPERPKFSIIMAKILWQKFLR